MLIKSFGFSFVAAAFALPVVVNAQKPSTVATVEVTPSARTAEVGRNGVSKGSAATACGVGLLDRW